MGVAQLCQKLKEKSRDNKTTQKILYYNPPLLTKSIAHYTTSTHTHTHLLLSRVCVCVRGWEDNNQRVLVGANAPHWILFFGCSLSRCVYILIIKFRKKKEKNFF
jgi:hypothetical protein